MRILVFDSALDKSYITLGLRDEMTSVTTLISRKINNVGTRYHSAYLVSQIQDILNENLVDIENIDAVGIDIGPGSFTGIRVGITVGKVICQQLNKRLVGVKSTDILSKVYLKENILSPVVMDAKRDMYYVFNPAVGKTPSLLNKEEMSEFFAELNENQTIICDGSSLEFLNENGRKCVCFEKENFNISEILANITFARLKNIKSATECHWSTVEPLYMQTPPVF